MSAHFGKGYIMKSIVKLAAVAALALGAQSAWSQSEQQIPQGSESVDVVAQASSSSGPRQEPVAREMQPRRLSTFEATGLAGDGPFPSKGGPYDD
jgi:hypothetical protein